jgi:hypothetical protein
MARQSWFAFDHGNQGTLLVGILSRKSVIELAIVRSLKKNGATQLLLLTGTEMDTVTWVVFGVITEGATVTVALLAETVLRTSWAALRQSSAVAPGTIPRRLPS